MGKADMRSACHLLVEKIMRLPDDGNRYNWLKQEMIDMLLDKGNSDDLEADYAAEYQYADIQNPYLVQVLKQYDKN